MLITSVRVCTQPESWMEQSTLVGVFKLSDPIERNFAGCQVFNVLRIRARSRESRWTKLELASWAKGALLCFKVLRSALCTTLTLNEHSPPNTKRVLSRGFPLESPGLAWGHDPRGRTMSVGRPEGFTPPNLVSVTSCVLCKIIWPRTCNRRSGCVACNAGAASTQGAF